MRNIPLYRLCLGPAWIRRQRVRLLLLQWLMRVLNTMTKYWRKKRDGSTTPSHLHLVSQMTIVTVCLNERRHVTRHTTSILPITTRTKQKPNRHHMLSKEKIKQKCVTSCRRKTLPKCNWEGVQTTPIAPLVQRWQLTIASKCPSPWSLRWHCLFPRCSSIWCWRHCESENTTASWEGCNSCLHNKNCFVTWCVCSLKRWQWQAYRCSLVVNPLALLFKSKD